MVFLPKRSSVKNDLDFLHKDILDCVNMSRKEELRLLLLFKIHKQPLDFFRNLYKVFFGKVL